MTPPNADPDAATGPAADPDATEAALDVSREGVAGPTVAPHTGGDDRPAAGPADGPDPASDIEFPDVAGLAYEHARDELVRIVSTLESGQADLEESMTLWRRGEALAAHCASWLDRAEAAIAAQAPQVDA